MVVGKTDKKYLQAIGQRQQGKPRNKFDKEVTLMTYAILGEKKKKKKSKENDALIHIPKRFG